jgi:hypothetical protein
VRALRLRGSRSHAVPGSQGASPAARLDALSLATESGNSLKSLKVVNSDGVTAMESAGRIAAGFNLEPAVEMTTESDFDRFSQSNELGEYLRSLS